METRYVQIICTACGGKIVALVGQPRPTTCALCKEPLEHLVAPTRTPTRPTGSASRAPATFTRGTFAGSSPRPPTAPSRPTGDVRKSTVQPPPGGSLKDKLIRLFRS